MADSWEENDDWEREDFTPALPATTAAVQPVNPITADVDASKFADEDAEAVDEKTFVVPASQVRMRGAGADEDKLSRSHLQDDSARCWACRIAQSFSRMRLLAA
jgi:hypothetical protein